MSPATTWTEQSVASTSYMEAPTAPGSGSIEGYALFGLPIPISEGIAFADATASWTENSVAASSYTEMTVTATTWTEMT
mgnify:CR=1 FL=1